VFLCNLQRCSNKTADAEPLPMHTDLHVSAGKDWGKYRTLCDVMRNRIMVNEFGVWGSLMQRGVWKGIVTYKKAYNKYIYEVDMFRVQ